MAIVGLRGGNFYFSGVLLYRECYNNIAGSGGAPPEKFLILATSLLVASET